MPAPGGEGTGRLLGVARHDRPRGAMETLRAADVTVLAGVEGDHRGALKPGRNRRQVTVLAAEGWRDALALIGADIPWQERRANLLVEGLALRETAGARLVFPSGLVLMVTGECDPCERMNALAPGLMAALTPFWRGGVTTRVIEGGPIRVGDAVTIEL